MAKSLEQQANMWAEQMELQKATTPENVAKTAYERSRAGRLAKGYIMPWYMRMEWDKLPKPYREFLVYMIRVGQRSMTGARTGS